MSEYMHHRAFADPNPVRSLNVSAQQPAQLSAVLHLGAAHLLLFMIASSWTINPPFQQWKGEDIFDLFYPLKIYVIVEVNNRFWNSFLEGYIGIRMMEKLIHDLDTADPTHGLYPPLDYYLENRPYLRYGRIIILPNAVNTLLGNATQKKVQTTESSTLSSNPQPPARFENSTQTDVQASNSSVQSLGNGATPGLRFDIIHHGSPVPLKTYLSLVFNALKDKVWARPHTRKLNKDTSRRKLVQFSSVGTYGLFVQILQGQQNFHPVDYYDLQVAIRILTSDQTFFKIAQFEYDVFYTFEDDFVPKEPFLRLLMVDMSDRAQLDRWNISPSDLLQTEDPVEPGGSIAVY